MNLQELLFTILRTYSFIHMDTLGRFSILVPLTGARTVNDNFHANSDNPVSLYLFGDNTCQSDIERTKFFRSNPNSFERLFSQLILQLTQLRDARPLDREFINALIEILNTQRLEALRFTNANPGLNIMTQDLVQDAPMIVSKGEFIVTGRPDTLRHLNLPNILNVLDEHADSAMKLLSDENSNDCLYSLSQIPKPRKENGLVRAITTVIRSANALAILSATPSEIFQRIYTELQGNYSFLGALQPSILSTLVEQFGALVLGEDFSLWTEQEIIDSVLLVFNQAKLIDEDQLDPMNSFAKIYHHAVDELVRANSGEIRQSSYKLFVLQSFLYLCAVHMRLKNPEHARTFLTNLYSVDQANQLIRNLCNDERGFITRMQRDFDISPAEYQVILTSCRQIALDHLEAPHFDELRTACMPLMLNNTHYLVIGGRLCWSTAPISDYGNLNSATSQADNFAIRFNELFSSTRLVIEREAILVNLRRLLNASIDYYDARAVDVLEANNVLLSEEQKHELLEIAISQGKYLSAQFLLQNGVFSEQLFMRALNQRPLDRRLIELFVSSNNDYVQYLTKSELFEAADSRHYQKALIILKYNPALTSSTNQKGQNYFILACATGQAYAIKQLVAAGANILVRDPVSGLTPRQLTLSCANARELHNVFATYYNHVKEKLSSDSTYIERYIINPTYINRAIEYGEVELAEIILSFDSGLSRSFSTDNLINAIKTNSQQAVALILKYRPELLEAVDDQGKTPFIHACERGDISIISHLLGLGANMFTSPPDGQGIFTARHLAYKLPAQQAAAVLALFKHHYQNVSPHNPQYALLFNRDNFLNVIKEGDYDLANAILEGQPEFEQLITAELLKRAISEDRVNQIDYIITKKPELLEHRDESQLTPFLWACEARNVQAMGCLMDAGAHVHYCIEDDSNAQKITARQLVKAQRTEDVDNSLQTRINQANDLLDSYPQRLEYLFNNSANYGRRFTTAHIIEATNERDLPVVEVILKHCRLLLEQLSPLNKIAIEQLQYQKAYNVRFDSILEHWQTKATALGRAEHLGAHLTANRLFEQLTEAGDRFFSCSLSQETVKQFKEDCTLALNAAKPIMQTHRGWHGFPLFIRAILGFLATLTVVPALIVHAATEKGYANTFFRCPETDSTTRLNQMEAGVQEIQSICEALV